MPDVSGTAFFSDNILAQGFLTNLEREVVLPRLMWRDVESDFAGRLGRTVDVRKPQLRTALTADIAPEDFQGVGVGGPLDSNNPSPTLTARAGLESYIPVTLDTRVYDRQPITDFSNTVDIQDRQLQVLAPMYRAVARGLENIAATLMTGATYPAGGQRSINSSTADPEDFVDLIADLAVDLDAANVPYEGRWFVVGNDYARALLKAPSVKQVDRAGTDEALRRATLLDHYGFTIVRSNAIPADSAYAFHESAYIMAMRAPVAPHGAKSAQSVALDGMAMTMVEDYDPDVAEDDVLVSTFVGTAVNTDPGLSGAGNPAGAPVFQRAIEVTVTAS